MLRHFEYHIEVLGLRSPHYIEKVVATEPLDTIDDACEVCGGVVLTAICLRDYHRHGLALPVDPAARVDHLSALALL